MFFFFYSWRQQKKIISQTRGWGDPPPGWLWKNLWFDPPSSPHTLKKLPRQRIYKKGHVMWYNIKKLMPYDPQNCIKDLLYTCTNCDYQIWVAQRRGIVVTEIECVNCDVNTGSLWELTTFDDGPGN